MDNNRTVAFVFLFLLAFLFYLYNSKNADGTTKLQKVVSAVTAGTAGNGVANRPLVQTSPMLTVPNSGTVNNGGVSGGYHTDQYGITIPNGGLPALPGLPTVKLNNYQNPQPSAPNILTGFFGNGAAAQSQVVPTVLSNTPGNLPGVNWTLGSNGYYTPPIVSTQGNTSLSLLQALGI